MRDLRTGDILMFRPTGWLGKMVAFITRSQYCHCGLVSHCGIASPTPTGAATKSHDVPLWRGIKGEDESEKTSTLLPSTPLPPASGGQRGNAAGGGQGGLSLLIEYREYVGYRVVEINAAITEWGSTPDVFRCETLDRGMAAKVVDEMMRDPLRGYGWWHAISTGLFRMLPKWVARWFDDECDHHAPHCSEAVCRAYRYGAGIDLVPDVPDWRTTPGNVAKSKQLKKME